MTLRDAHLHIGAYGESLEAVDLADCGSAEDALARIAESAASVPSEGWVTAIRARPEGWSEPRWPSHAELARAAGGRPAVIRSFDIHSRVASTDALRLAGIDRATPDPPGGRIDRDAHGQPTGLLLEAAAFLLDSAVPAVTHEQLVRRVKLAADDLAARGFVEVHDMWTDRPLARAVRALDAAGELPLRVGLAPLHETMACCLADEAFAPSERVRTVGIKVFTDGTLNSRTAHMLEPYAEPDPAHPRGMPLMSADEIAAAVRDADNAGLPLIAHAIGDAAVRTCLDAITAAAPSTPGQRIEHAQFVDPADTPRFAAMGIIASVQPCPLLPDVEALRRLVPHRLERAFPLRELVDAARDAGRDPAELVWMGSDAPVVPPCPGDNEQAAVRRCRPGTEPIALEQAITADECRALSQASPEWGAA